MKYSPSVTTDVVVFTIENDELKVLLIKRPDEPFKGYWALPGGFIHESENTHEAAIRILKDKAGIKNVYIEQLYTFDGKNRDPRGAVITVSYYALVTKSDLKFDFTERTQSPQLIPVKKLPNLAFDHKEIIDYARKRLQSKLEYTNVAYSLLPKYFTLNQLQKTYEVILGRKLDKRNFRKKFMQLKVIKATPKMLRGTRQRPARLYEFFSHRLTELKKFF